MHAYRQGAETTIEITCRSILITIDGPLAAIGSADSEEGPDKPTTLRRDRPRRFPIARFEERTGMNQLGSDRVMR
jgi:hypothetical protein